MKKQHWMYMIIKKLVLHRYKRLSLNQIDTLEYNPKEHIQIILGSNSSGKSSTLRELSPLPADLTKDYHEDGYKIIHIEHMGKHFKLSSGYESKNRHSFIIGDDTELNDSGTRKVQLGLVKEYFGLTPVIHEILLGNVCFTSMSTAERKYWLTEISSIDYTYSLKVYNYFKQKHRDIVGALKITKNKLLQEDIKILSKDEKDKLHKDRDAYTGILEYLLSIKELVTDKTKDSGIHTTTNSIKEILSTLSDGNNYNKEDIIKSDITIRTLENDITLLSKKMEELNKITSNYTLEELNKELSIINIQISELIKYNTLNIDLNNLDYITTIFLDIKNELLNIVPELDTVDIYYNNELLTEKNNKRVTTVDMLSKYDRVLAKLLADKEHMDKHKDDPLIQCSNCNHSWNLNYDKKLYSELVTKIDKLSLEINNIKNTLTAIDVDIDKYNKKKNIIDKVKQLISNTKSISTIWTYLLNNIDIQKDTYIVISRLNEVTIQLDKLSAYKKLDTTRKQLIQDIELNKKLDNVNKKSQDELKLSTNNEIADKTSQLIKLKQHRNMIIRSIENKDSLLNKYDQLYKSIQIEYTNMQSSITIARNDAINEMISIIKYHLSVLEKQIRDSDTLEVMIKQTQKEINDLTIKEKVLKLIVKELSPSEGMIAESINSFLNIFIKDINHIINSVWTYDLKLLPCHVDENNDLDYKFPMSNNGNETIDDISKGSGGMKEIIDLAFKVVFIKYLGLTDWPLYLDEYAVKMDAVHRINAYSVIENILSNNFSQVFLISHFESMYGRFKNADISILSNDNIMFDLDVDYNSVLKIN